MIILDTNVLSELMQRDPNRKVIAWLDAKPRHSLWTTSVTILEIRYGIQLMVTGKRQVALTRAFEGLMEKMANQTASFDAEAAQIAGDLMARRKKKGLAGDLRDTMIAGIALAREATLATRNAAHFADAGLALVNPWTD